MFSAIELRLRDWTQARARTYDLLQALSLLDAAILKKRLPFPQSQSLAYQFWCMLGAQESYAAMIEAGSWQGFRSSLDVHDPELDAGTIAGQMRHADAALFDAVELRLASLGTGEEGEGGAAGCSNEEVEKVSDTLHTLALHEVQHQGQLINFIFGIGLPIPQSWERQWALRHEDDQDRT